MFIIPLEKSLDWKKKPPLATVALILANTLILLFGPDGSARHKHWVTGYGFIPAEHRPITFLTHAFLHGGLGHLLGNMVFLFLVGCTVEASLGAGLYLAFYLLGGLCAVSLFWLLDPASTVPLVGASGCIAGLMGLYAALFGWRKIRFFYSAVVYFGYANAPAIILLPLWLANEYLQLRFGNDTHVAYAAHMGGLAGGGLLGWMVTRWQGRVDTGYLDESERRKNRERHFAQGLRHLHALEIDQACASFQSLVDADPQDYEALLQLCKTAKLRPQSPQYRRVSEQLLRLPPCPTLSLRELHQVFLDRRQQAAALPADLSLALARRFHAGGFTDTAQGIAQDLLAADCRDAELADLLLVLAAGFRRAGREDRHRQCLDWVLQKFPEHEAARLARQMLDGAR